MKKKMTSIPINVIILIHHAGLKLRYNGEVGLSAPVLLLNSILEEVRDFPLLTRAFS